jgi:hypothetical protein
MMYWSNCENSLQQVEHQPYQQHQQGYQQQSPQQAQHQPQPAGYQQQQPGTPQQPQQPTPHQQQQLQQPPQQPQQQQSLQQPNDSWGYEWNQTNQDASWNWDDSDAAEATLNASKVEQLGQQMADVNLNQEPVVQKEPAPPTPKQQQPVQQQQPQAQVHQEPPPPMHSQQRRPQLQNSYQLDEYEIRQPEEQGAEMYDVVENVEVPLAYAEEQVRPNHENKNLEVEPDNVEAPADEVVRLPAVSPLPPPPPVTSRVAVGQVCISTDFLIFALLTLCDCSGN